MKPLIFRVRPGSNYELNDSNQLYVVDFLLDCVIAWVKIRDSVSLHDTKKARSQLILNKLSLLLYSITTDPIHKAPVKVRVEPMKILAMMAGHLTFFSQLEQEECMEIIKYELKEYL